MVLGGALKKTVFKRIGLQYLMQKTLFVFIILMFALCRTGHEPITEEDEKPLTHEELKQKIMNDVSTKGQRESWMQS